MMNYVCDFSQSETEKYFELIIMPFSELLPTFLLFYDIALIKLAHLVA